MTDIQVLLDNIKVVVLSCSGTVLLLWGLWFFFRSLFKEAGRDPVRIAIAVAAIAGAGAAFALIPAALSAGSSTGEQIGGGGGYSMPAPPALQQPHIDTAARSSIA